MKALPTAEEFLREKYTGEFTQEGATNLFDLYEVQQVMIEFAKLHCEAQVKEITEKVKVVYIEPDGCATGDYYDVDKDSIINAYNLNDIK
jgi:hypothetical protein